MINQFYIDYIKAIENPNRVGWNGKVWIAPQYKGYDKNQRGYGIDIFKNDSAKRLTQNRPGQWLTEGEADRLMKEHLLYVYGAALKHIEGFDNLSDRRKAALLGMLYRGDSVNKNRHIININEPDDNKFFESISNYYKSKGLNERARNSSNFFSNNQLQTKFLIPMKWELWEPPMKFKSGGQIRKMQTASGGPLVLSGKSQKGIPKNGITINKSVPEIIVVPNKLYLDTFYPVISNDYPITGHSRIVGLAFTEDGFKEAEIDKLMDDAGYNLITNNCADATKCVLENISGKKMNPYFFTTPGDVLSFFKKNFDVRKSTNSSFGNPVYYTNISEADFDKIKDLEQQLLAANGKMILKQFKQLTLNKKDGGKMNTLEFLKNGSGIHIKKKNRGKFTSYCGGKVTNECILKGKNSSNPTIRKRATFAANARKWKHKEGGIIKALEGTNTNSFGLFMNNGGYLMLGNLATGIALTATLNKQASALGEQLKAQLKGTFEEIKKLLVLNALDKMNEQKLKWQLSYLNGETLDLSFNSEAYLNFLKGKYINNAIDEAKNAYNNQSKIIDAQVQSLKDKNTANLISGIAQQGMGLIGDFLSKKSFSSKPKNPTTNSYFDNYVNTNYYKKFGTFNSNGSMNMLGGTFTINGGYKPNKPQFFNYQLPKLGV